MLWQVGIDLLPVRRSHVVGAARLIHLAPLKPDAAGLGADRDAIAAAAGPLHQKVDVQIHHAPSGELVPINQAVSNNERQNIDSAINLIAPRFSIPHVRVTETDSERDKLLTYFGVETLAEISVTDYPRVIRSLEKRRSA